MDMLQTLSNFNGTLKKTTEDSLDIHNKFPYEYYNRIIKCRLYVFAFYTIHYLYESVRVGLKWIQT